MMSDLYYYFSIRADENLSDKRPLCDVKRFISQLPELARKNAISYQNAAHFPWVSVTLINARSFESWREDSDIDEVNLVVVVGSRYDGTENVRMCYLDLVFQIANYLQWEVVEENEGNDGADVVLHKP